MNNRYLIEDIQGALAQAQGAGGSLYRGVSAANRVYNTPGVREVFNFGLDQAGKAVKRKLQEYIGDDSGGDEQMARTKARTSAGGGGGGVKSGATQGANSRGSPNRKKVSRRKKRGRKGKSRRRFSRKRKGSLKRYIQKIMDGPQGNWLSKGVKGFQIAPASDQRLGFMIVTGQHPTMQFPDEELALPAPWANPVPGGTVKLGDLAHPLYNAGYLNASGEILSSLSGSVETTVIDKMPAYHDYSSCKVIFKNNSNTTAIIKMYRLKRIDSSGSDFMTYVKSSNGGVPSYYNAGYHYMNLCDFKHHFTRYWGFGKPTYFTIPPGEFRSIQAPFYLKNKKMYDINKLMSNSLDNADRVKRYLYFEVQGVIGHNPTTKAVGPLPTSIDVQCSWAVRWTRQVAHASDKISNFSYHGLISGATRVTNPEGANPADAANQ